MKKTMFAFLAAIAVLLAAAQADAYAIYNHTDYTVCVYTYSSCNFKVHPHSHHNGAHGSALKNVCMEYRKGKHGNCYHACPGEDVWDIPAGGYARVWKHEVKVYKHDGKCVLTMPITEDNVCLE